MQLNNLHYTLMFLLGVFLLLWALNPKRPKLATGYLRYVVLGLAAAMVLSPFYWLLSAAFKDSDVLMRYTFQPPVSTWDKEYDVSMEAIDEIPAFAKRIYNGRDTEDLSPENQLWQSLPEEGRTLVTNLAARVQEENRVYTEKRDPLKAVRVELEEQQETLESQIAQGKPSVDEEETPPEHAGE
ncbi:MAG: hypothetical protein ACOC2L_01495, partial [Candidatus Sumerlaeota bacterium]